MAAALVTLTTDFGTQDSYVAEMKGVLLSSIQTGVQLVDLSHEIPRHDVAAGAQFLAAAVPCFPPGTVHLVVIDPGVGSDRAPLAAKYRDQFLVLPDNGLLSQLEDGAVTCVALDVHSLGPERKSATFHGRDVFAPAAARLAQGVPLTALGSPLDSPVRLPRPQAERGANGIRGEIIHIDHFGNLLTNIDRAEVAALQAVAGPCLVHCGSFTGPIRDHYAEVRKGAPLSLFDSQQRLEVAVREGHAGAQLRCKRGDPVEVCPSKPIG